MPQVKGKENRSGDENQKSSNYEPYDPSEDGYDPDQEEEIRQWEAGQQRFFDELANAKNDD